MMTVKEVSKLTGVSIRTLQYYDSIGLLKPTKYTDSGYRLYDDRVLFSEFGELKFLTPDDDRVQEQVKKLQQYITDHYYQCTTEILYGLGQMYAAGGEFTENIDKTGGVGTSQFVQEAIQVYCKK